MTARFLASEQAEIDAVQAACTQVDLNAWFDSSQVKARFKKVCMHAQALRCCYCQKFIDSIHSSLWDLEHVLSEDDYPEFFTVEGNLALACKACNTAKANKDVLVAWHLRPPGTLPSNSSDYTIPHPRIDDWNESLSHVNFQIYTSRNDKGLELIKVCKLNAPALEDAGLDYDAVVAAVTTKFFETMGSDLPSSFSNEQALDRMARLTQARDELRYEMHATPLAEAIASYDKKAAKRSPETSAAQAQAMALIRLEGEVASSPLTYKVGGATLSIKVLRVAETPATTPLLLEKDPET